MDFGGLCVNVDSSMDKKYIYIYHSVSNVDKGRNHTCIKEGGIWETSVLSLKFSCKPKTA